MLVIMSWTGTLLRFLPGGGCWRLFYAKGGEELIGAEGGRGWDFRKWGMPMRNFAAGPVRLWARRPGAGPVAAGRGSRLRGYGQKKRG